MRIASLLLPNFTVLRIRKAIAGHVMEIYIVANENPSIDARLYLPTTALLVVISPSTEERASRITVSTANS